MGNLLKKLVTPLVAASLLLSPIHAEEPKKYSVSASLGPFNFLTSTKDNPYKNFFAYKIGVGLATANESKTNFELSFVSQNLSSSIGDGTYQKNTLGFFLFDLDWTNALHIGNNALYYVGGLSYLGGAEQAELIDSKGKTIDKKSADFSGWGSFFGGGVEIVFNPSLSVCIEGRVRNLQIGDLSLFSTSLEAGVTYNF